MYLRVKEICKDKGVTMAWLSDKTGIAYNALYSIPNGNPTVGTLQKIAEALGVPVVELFEASNAISKSESQTPAVNLLESVKEFAEKNKDNVSKHKKAMALYFHLQRYNVDIETGKVNKAYIDGFTEYLKTTTNKRVKAPLSDESVKTYIDFLKTVLYSTIDNLMGWAN